MVGSQKSETFHIIHIIFQTSNTTVNLTKHKRNNDDDDVISQPNRGHFCGAKTTPPAPFWWVPKGLPKHSETILCRLDLRRALFNMTTWWIVSNICKVAELRLKYYTWFQSGSILRPSHHQERTVFYTKFLKAGFVIALQMFHTRRETTNNVNAVCVSFCCATPRALIQCMLAHWQSQSRCNSCTWM